MMRFGSVCSGIEAASIAWIPLGWEAAWFAEVDRAASEVLAYRFPHITNHGDMTKLADMVLAGEIEAPDILVGGTPCQAFSVAGRREGLADGRGQLTLAFVDLAHAIDRVRRLAGKQPCIIVWENVPGILSDRTGAFSCFLAGIVGDDQPVEPGPRPERGRSSAHWTWDKAAGEHRTKWTDAGYVAGPERAAAWRIQDAQYHGLAQRRRRVFVVASAREDIDPAAILLEFDGVRRDSAPSREKGQIAAGTLDARTTGGGFPGTDGACSGHDVPAARRPAGVDQPVPTWWDGRDVSQTLDAVLHKGQTMPEKNRFPAVLHPVVSARESGPGWWTQDDVAGSLRVGGDIESAAAILQPVAFSVKDHGGDATVDMSPTLRSMGHADSHANGGGQVGIAYAFQPRIARNGRGDMGDVVNALTAQAGETGKGDAAPCVAYGVLPFDTTQITSPSNYSSPREGDPCHPLAAGAHPPAVCITGDVTHTLKAEGFDASEDGTGRGQSVVPATMYSIMPMNSGRDYKAREVDVAQPLMAAGPVGGNQGGDYLLEHVHMAVRRLMPEECEALQGFPRGWTLVPTKKVTKANQEKARANPGNAFIEIDGEMWNLAADGPRYKQCGNSMATNVMHWIGRRIKAALPGDNGGPPLEDLIG